ncbi:cysteine desulfurase family protein [Macrococcoides goetzii]|uniref:cysteine desulfurase family protein n=1 Tax=Macrococcus TaxID=69965 RepID=UPI001EF1AB56|nr:MULTISPECIES: aminotransferase class V-fold PLP-dependent enzyme [Macrococcus]MCG7418853.1 aminotransferase class V-fold PLP-dependent enzyme [Macrococcus epidermidis]MCH4984352.1 aminotransferase class V-fold PLP-dependent enzyme [Macrococcus sp. PK]MCH4985731.1 aminotransferase class V-fold PLP-dependent enzyme [Macrococcus sp. PK]
MINLDYAATSPMSASAMQRYFDTNQKFYYNSESLHSGGDMVKDIVHNCENALNGYFTDNFTLVTSTSGSHANEMALNNYLYHESNKTIILTSKFEHPSVYAALHEHARYDIHYFPEDETGMIDLTLTEQFIQQYHETIACVSCVHVSSETGYIFPIEQIGKLTNQFNIPFHIDAVQSAGKLRIPTQYVTSLSISGHKFFGPKGIGALLIREEALRITNPFYHHEHHMRNGTVDVPSLVAMTQALIDYKQSDTIQQFNHKIITTLDPALYVPMKFEPQLKNIIPILINKTDGQYIMQQLSQHNILISTGTACGHGTMHSRGLETLITKQSYSVHQYIRVSLSTLTTEEEINTFLEVINQIT